MEQHTFKIYDAEVTVYEFKHEEFFNANIEIEGDITPISILENGIYTPASRELQSYYARGFAEDRDIYVLADYIDTKQLSNLFLSLGATSAIAAAYDITKVKISEGFKIEDLADVEPIEKPKKKKRK